MLSCVCGVNVAGGCKATNPELLKRVRAAYDNRLTELYDELSQVGDSTLCSCQPNSPVDKSSTLSEKRLDVLLRQLNNLKRSNVSSSLLAYSTYSLDGI